MNHTAQHQRKQRNMALLLAITLSAACSTSSERAPAATALPDTLSFSDGAVAADGTAADAATSADSAAVDVTDLDASADDTVADAMKHDSDGSDGGLTEDTTADSGAQPEIACGFVPQWLKPLSGDFAAAGDQVTLSVQVPTAALQQGPLTAHWQVDGAPLAQTTVGTDGIATLATTQLPVGAVVLQVSIVTLKGPCKELAERQVGICAHKIAENFSTKPTGTVWKTNGDAYWDKGGWLEMTGNQQGKAGAFYDVLHNVSPGDASVRFRIATGGGINSGADGYALNFVEAPAISDLEKIIKAAGKGGCLGYGVSGKCGTLKVVGFHVEFDTWQNKGDPNKDPTSANHIGIMLNGDAGDHKLHVPLANLEDLKWHDVRVDVVGTTVRVMWDGVQKVKKEISGLDFRGGRIFISGSTGWATNYHRLDDLVVLHGCK